MPPVIITRAPRKTEKRESESIAIALCPPR
jgi:hypothetical protein